MPRYIDADKIPYYPDTSEDAPMEGRMITFKADIDKLPIADVVEVVRCEKCKYLKHTRGHIPYCKRMDEYADGDNLYEVSYDDFCSYGERIDNNG